MANFWNEFAGGLGTGFQLGSAFRQRRRERALSDLFGREASNIQSGDYGGFLSGLSEVGGVSPEQGLGYMQSIGALQGQQQAQKTAQDAQLAALMMSVDGPESLARAKRIAVDRLGVSPEFIGRLGMDHIPQIRAMGMTTAQHYANSRDQARFQHEMERANFEFGLLKDQTRMNAASAILGATADEPRIVGGALQGPTRDAQSAMRQGMPMQRALQGQRLVEDGTAAAGAPRGYGLDGVRPGAFGRGQSGGASAMPSYWDAGVRITGLPNDQVVANAQRVRELAPTLAEAQNNWPQHWTKLRPQDWREGDKVMIEPAFGDALQALQDELGVEFDFSTHGTQRAPHVGGGGGRIFDSPHKVGRSADIVRPQGVTYEQMKAVADKYNIGVMRYDHLDHFDLSMNDRRMANRGERRPVDTGSALPPVEPPVSAFGRSVMAAREASVPGAALVDPNMSQAAQEFLRRAGRAPQEVDRGAVSDSVSRLVRSIDRLPENQRSNAYRNARSMLARMGYEVGGAPEEYSPEAFDAMRNMFGDREYDDEQRTAALKQIGDMIVNVRGGGQSADADIGSLVRNAGGPAADSRPKGEAYREARDLLIKAQWPGADRLPEEVPGDFSRFSTGDGVTEFERLLGLLSPDQQERAVLIKMGLEGRAGSESSQYEQRERALGDMARRMDIDVTEEDVARFVLRGKLPVGLEGALGGSGEDTAGVDRQYQQSIRKEYEGLGEVKEFREVQNSVFTIHRLLSDPRNVSAGRAHAAIFSLMKTLDPTSTVREGEFATVENIGGVPQALRSIYNKFLDEGRMTPHLARELRDVTDTLYAERQRAYAPIFDRFVSIAEESGLPVDTTIYDYRRSAPGASRDVADFTDDEIGGVARSWIDRGVVSIPNTELDGAVETWIDGRPLPMKRNNL